MKNLFWTLIVIAVLLNLAAPKLRAVWNAHNQWRVGVAVQQIEQAKAQFAQANSDNQNALDVFNASTAEERILALEDAGLLADKTALYVSDVGSLYEHPTPRTSAEMEQVAQKSRSGLGTALASL